MCDCGCTIRGAQVCAVALTDERVGESLIFCVPKVVMGVSWISQRSVDVTHHEVPFRLTARHRSRMASTGTVVEVCRYDTHRIFTLTRVGAESSIRWKARTGWLTHV